VSIEAQIHAKAAEKSLTQSQAKRISDAPLKEDQERAKDRADYSKAVSWFKIETRDKVELSPVANLTQVDVTAVPVAAHEVAAPTSILGYNIDLKAKISEYKDKYKSNIAQTSSHNLGIKLYASAKASFYGAVLSMLGVSPNELSALKSEATASARTQNEQLFCENEYNGELLATVGGKKKDMKAQQKIVGVIRKQLIEQAANLGMKDAYSEDKIAQIQLEQCKKILGKFQEERTNLVYQLDYLGEMSDAKQA